MLQVWADMHNNNNTTNNNKLSDRTYWGAVYALAIGVNYGAFSLVFGSSLAGLGWQKDLQRQHIWVRRKDFARDNLPFIVIAMAVSCTVLVGEVYIVRSGDTPYVIRS